MDTPKTLLDAIQYFSDSENCRKFMISMRWADGVVLCPRCGSEKVAYLEKAKLYFCKVKHPKQKFSLKVGTIFEDSAIGLEKWLPAFWLLSNCKNGISSYELGRALGVTQKSAWFMLHRIRVVMGDDNSGKIGGSPKNPVEIDEMYLQANPRKMNRKQFVGRNDGDKNAIVMGMKTRNTREVRAMVIPDAKRTTLQEKILEHVGWGAHIHTDQWIGYDKLSATNNSKGKTDAMRFNKLVSQVEGKRLTYAEVTGKVGIPEVF